MVFHAPVALTTCLRRVTYIWSKPATLIAWAVRVAMLTALLSGWGGTCHAQALQNGTVNGPLDYTAYTNFWLSISNSGTTTYLTIESTLSNLTYLVLTNNNLANSNGWGIWQVLLATNNVTPAPPLQAGTHGTYFSAALVWSTCPNPSAMPDWLSMLRFHSLCVTATGGYITTGLVAYWRLNDRSGTIAADSSGNGVELALLGAPSWGPDWLNLDGNPNSPQYGDAGPNVLTDLDTNDVTICAWINKTGSSQKGIVDKSYYTSGGYGGWSFQILSDNRLDWWTEENLDLQDSGGATVTPGQWTFVALAWHYVNHQCEFYINGALNSTLQNGASIENPSGTADLELGNIRNNSSGGIYAFDGSMHDVGLYNRALSPAEVESNYLSTEFATNVCIPDLLYYEMTEYPESNSPVSFTDSSTHGGTTGTMFLVGGLHWVTNDVPNNAIHFNGANSYLETSNSVLFNFTTNLFTINFWTEPLTANGYVMDNGIEALNGWYVRVGGSYEIYFGTETNGVDAGLATGPGAAQVNAWNMVTIVRTGPTNALIYINGLQVPTTGSIISPAPSTNSLILGVNRIGPGFGTNYLDGDVWLTQIWGEPLPATSIANLYFNQASGHPWPLGSSTPLAQFGYVQNADNTFTITNYTGSGSVVIIPAVIDGFLVTGIGGEAFDYQTDLTSVTIPAGVTNIGAGAFEGCTSLTNIIVDTNNSAYSSVNGVLFNQSRSALIQYAGGLGGGYTIPNTVTRIGDDAFAACYGLSSVTVPGSVTAIGTAAFAYCKYMTNATMANGVASIGNFAFYGCASLPTVTLPGTVTNLGQYIFQNSSRLTNVTIGNGVTNIGGYAFYGCNGLTNVAIPASVTAIGQDAFAWCSALSTVTIPTGITAIGDYAYAWCSNLTTVTISAGVTSIGYALFADSSNLASVYFQGNAPAIMGNYYDGPVFYNDSSVTVYYLPGASGWGSTFSGAPVAQWGSH
jgi:hypothetical protein